MAYLAVREIVQTHIEGSHPAQLPDFAPACPNCQEWALTTGACAPPGLNATTTLPLMEREARLHRAGHLLPEPTHAASRPW